MVRLDVDVSMTVPTSPLHNQRRLTRASVKPWLLLLLALPAAQAHAEIYACPGRRDVIVYQNFPCPFNSLGSVPDDAGTPPHARATNGSQ